MSPLSTLFWPHGATYPLHLLPTLLSGIITAKWAETAPFSSRPPSFYSRPSRDDICHCRVPASSLPAILLRTICGSFSQGTAALATADDPDSINLVTFDGASNEPTAALEE